MARTTRLGVLLFPLLWLAVPLSAQEVPPPQPSRVGLALVIGNSRYAQAELPTVDLDRRAMAKALESQGFRVREVENLQRPRDFEETLRRFLEDENAAPEDILLVYYSGHGLQIDGKPYLLGTGVKAAADMSSALREYAQDVEEIISIMEDAAPEARVLIIDACRNNAFATNTRKAGAAFQRSITDTYLLFADEPGKTVPARTDTSIQSPFTAGLLYAFENSAAGIEARFEIARDKTRELNPDQNPRLERSDPSENRDRAFLDRAGRSAPTRSAVQILTEARVDYETRSWRAFRDRVRAARVLSADGELSARLEREASFADLALDAQAAESDSAGPKWMAAAAAWQKAAALFPARAWTIEQSAIDWLLANHPAEAATALARIQGRSDAIAERAKSMLAVLLQADAALEAAVRSAALNGPSSTGVEFDAPPSSK